jgi:oligosaccharide repeat unit polymerase
MKNQMSELAQRLHADWFSRSSSAGPAAAQLDYALPKKQAILSPLSLKWGIWIAIFFLYSLNLSKLLLFDLGEFPHVLFAILLPFSSAILLSKLLATGGKRVVAPDEYTLEVINWRLVSRLCQVWGIATILEIIVSGGVPLLWIIIGNGKTYFDFGLQSLHGLLNALLSSVTLLFTYAAVRSGRKKFWIIPIFTILWSVITITRQMFIVTVIEMAVLILLVKGITLRAALKLLFSVFLVVLVFGIVGDVRSGADEFLQLAQPTANWPLWLPSGFLWVYIYMVTPLNNLLNTTISASIQCSPLFPGTLSLAFPSIIRGIVFGDKATEFWSGDLVTEAFNVSTAYIAPYQDCGILGMSIYSFLLGLAAHYFWRKNSLNGFLGYAVIAECIISSIFFNHLFYLPIIFQLFFLRIFVAKVVVRNTHERP